MLMAAAEDQPQFEITEDQATEISELIRGASDETYDEDDLERIDNAPPPVQIDEFVPTTPAEDDEIALRIKLSPETIKRMKVLAILGSPQVIVSLKEQLQVTVNDCFDQLIQDELRQHLASSGVLPESQLQPAIPGTTAGPAPTTPRATRAAQAAQAAATDSFSHSLSNDEEDPPEDEDPTGEKKPMVLAGQFEDVGEDADAHLDAIFTEIKPSRQSRQQNEDQQLAALAGAPGVSGGSGGMTDARKAYDGKKKANVYVARAGELN